MEQNYDCRRQGTTIAGSKAFGATTSLRRPGREVNGTVAGERAGQVEARGRIPKN